MAKEVTLEEIWFKVSLEKVTTQALYGVLKRQYVDTSPILDILTLIYKDKVAQFNPKVGSGDLVQLNPAFTHLARGGADEYSESPRFATGWVLAHNAT